MNIYLKYQKPRIQFVAFMSFAIGFYFISILLYISFFNDVVLFNTAKNIAATPEIITRFKWLQLLSALLMFLTPALLFGYFSAPKPFEYLGLRKNFSALVLTLSVVLLFAVQPFAAWVGNLNEKINFGSLQKTFADTQADYIRTMQIFLKMSGPADVVINLFIMALLPAICEELFFRGSLQKVLLRWSKSPWLAILISSLIFALLHSTPFKFFPIFVLGIMLGTVYYVTRNIWYCVIIHFLNNALAVLSEYYGSKSETLRKLADDKLSFPIYWVVLSIVATIAIIYVLKRKSDSVLPAFVTDDDNDYIAS